MEHDWRSTVAKRQGEQDTRRGHRGGYGQNLQPLRHSWRRGTAASGVCRLGKECSRDQRQSEIPFATEDYQELLEQDPMR